MRIDQLIERGNMGDLRIAAAWTIENASSEDLGDVLRQQRLALRVAYYDPLFAQHKAAILLAKAQSFERTLKVAELPRKTGEIAASDVVRTRVDAARSGREPQTALKILGDIYGS